MTYNDRTAGEQARAAWTLAVEVLKRSGMTDTQARRFFGRLLSSNKLTGNQLLEAVRACDFSGTQDAAGYLTRVASRINGSRNDPGLQTSWT